MAGDSAQQREAGGQGAVLRRLMKARNHSRADAGEAPGLPQNLPQTPARAGAIAVCRAAEDLYGLPLRTVSVVPGGMTLAELPEMLPDPALLSVVSGPQDMVGFVAIDPVLVTTLIEVQALGRVTGRPVEPRRLTRSDATMCTDFVNRLLKELHVEITGLEGFEGYAGYSYLSHLEDPRPLPLMLEDTAFRTLRMRLAIGGDGRREGTLFVALPQPRAGIAAPVPRPVVVGAARPLRQPEPAPRTAAAAKPRPADTVAGQPEPAAAGPTLGAAMQAAPIDIVGVLCRRRVSLRDLRALVPGALLPLPRVSLLDARIETRQGQVLAHGKLGEADGCHAIRLHDPSAIRPGADLRRSPLGAPLGAGAALEPPLGDAALPDAFRSDEWSGEVATLARSG